MIRLERNNATGETDIALDDDGRIDSSAGWESCVEASLFSRRRDPTRDGQKFGWWGDTISRRRLGSLLWTLQRERVNVDTLRAVKRYIEESLAWMVEDAIAKSVVATVERYNSNTIAARVEILRTDGQQWSKIWKVHFGI